MFETASRMCEFAIGVTVQENESSAYVVALVRVFLRVVPPLTR
jgi:hypothetical protein